MTFSLNAKISAVSITQILCCLIYILTLIQHLVYVGWRTLGTFPTDNNNTLYDADQILCVSFSLEFFSNAALFCDLG